MKNIFKFKLLNKNDKKNRGRPAQLRFKFLERHPQVLTHILIQRATNVIPVLIGPQIPRQNCELTQERYCRCILTLFKPWRTFLDLCDLEENWFPAFRKHEGYFHESDCMEMIGNIELLHECKEHRNEHLAQIIE